MKKIRNKALVIAVSFAMLMVCFAAMTVTSFADEDAAFTVTTNYYQEDADLSVAEPIRTVTTTYTDAGFKALGEDFDSTVKYAFNKGGWNVIQVVHGVSLQNILADNAIDPAYVQEIQLTDWYKGKAEVYGKRTYGKLFNADGYFFPNTKGTDAALNLEGGYQVPNCVIATTYASATVTDETAIGEAVLGDPVEQFATATDSSYRMMVGGDAEGNVEGAPIAGNSFCSGVSGVIITSTEKEAQVLKAKNVTKSVKYSKVKKSAQTVKTPVKVTGNQTALTYKKVKVNKKAGNFTVNAKNGSIKIKKKTPKGTYKVTVKASAAEDAFYKAASKSYVVTIKIK